MSQLTIYKASAGSGKTFKLTEEYLKLLFKYPENYRRILAVTFTNKATAEMKNRILSELNKLAKGIKSDYLEELKTEYKLSEVEIKLKASKILSLLLHDFSKFSVSTIDKFFQKIIRSFTREIGIQPGYTIELNQNDILLKVIDNLLLDLDENTELRKWLSNLASDKIEQGNKWDFKDDILKLAKEIFKENYKAFNQKLIKKMSDKEFLKSYNQELQQIKSTFENTITNHSKKAIELIATRGLTLDDFSFKASGPAGYFYKAVQKNEFAPGKNFLKGVEDVTKWHTKSSEKKELIESLFSEGLQELALSINNFYSKNYIQYYSSVEILKFIRTLGILTDISGKLREYCEEQNIFLISDSAKLLQIIIDNNDSPFIYEKTGNIYKHFMIDEFQDTSKTQWHNFKPLINNSLAQGSKNLLVGDIKQSIYRWRNSDWKILSDEVQKDFIQFNPETQALNTNWRSRKNIIDFNNSVFSYSSQVLQQNFNGEFTESENLDNPYKTKITDAYQDVFQNIPENNSKEDGYINHTFLSEKEYDSWKDEVKSRLPGIIEDLQEKAYHLNDIAILVRSSKEGQDIANTLIEYKNQSETKYKFDFISNDSLFIANSSLVKFIISILEYILDSNDDINLSFIAHEYNCYLKSDELSNAELHELLINHTKEEQEEWLKKLFPKEFIESLDQIKQLPVYELTDRIIRLFRLNEIKAELPYLNAFLDIVLDFSKKSASDIHTFINWWEETGNKKTLSVSENQDAIRILTIHSSKGLEFKNVIIPFCNWDIDHKSNQTNILWCKTDAEPFDQLDLIPVKYSGKLSNTVFKPDYLKEKLHAYVDNLNLLYVAFTRVKENLFCFSPLKDKTKKISNVGNLLFFTYQNYKNYPTDKTLIDFTDHWNTQTTSFEFGELKKVMDVKKDLPDEFEINQFESFDIKNKLRLKLHDNSFFTGQENAPFEKVNHGKVMHEIFENIKTEKDISQAIDKLIFDGKISPDEKPDIKQKIEETFKNEQIKNWFSDEWQIKTEAEIILTNGKTARPDRVISNNNKIIVIDYKFGEQEEEKHHKQVESYMEILRKMENKVIEGYLWYVDLNFIRKIK
ncbi:MAG: UvrD-helicase domain-containing protein [Bacteroidales bacterium]|nr:UvrD-helicase domain-containing protein [Bacteroidales bacterium]